MFFMDEGKIVVGEMLKIVPERHLGAYMLGATPRRLNKVLSALNRIA